MKNHRSPCVYNKAEPQRMPVSGAVSGQNLSGALQFLPPILEGAGVLVQVAWRARRHQVRRRIVLRLFHVAIAHPGTAAHRLQVIDMPSVAESMPAIGAASAEHSAHMLPLRFGQFHALTPTRQAATRRSVGLPQSKGRRPVEV